MKLGSLTDELRMLQGVRPATPVVKQPAGMGDGVQKNAPSFGDFLEKQLNEMNQMGLDVDQKINDTIQGKVANPHETMIAIQQADISFKLMLNVKEQLEQTYQTIMRTSIG